MAVRVASAAATAAAASPAVGSMVGASAVAATAVGVVAGRPRGCCCHAVEVRRRWSEDGSAPLGAQLNYGWDRCWRCDSWLRCRGAWWEEVG
jgi:hypothetical protein